MLCVFIDLLIPLVAYIFVQDPADLWMSDWLSELRYSLEASFEAIWQQFDSDGNGELDTHELDHLVAEMLKVSWRAVLIWSIALVYITNKYEP